MTDDAPGPTPTHTNALIHETSPYLLQHAHNPVAWRGWGEAAFRAAREGNKPVFLSIGYAACHWCHVMERESFENERVAAYLNEHFISIKVDREERPDVDAIYMQAVQMMSGSGGWPLTVFLTPELKPFFGGTYFPPDSRYGRIGFLALLERIREVWVNQRAEALRSGGQLAGALAEASHAPAVAGAIGIEIVAAAASDLARRFDARDGGFGGAPKFPPSMALNLLLAEWKRTGDAGLLEMVQLTLQKMAHGGIYDQIGGGFHRYSTDERWLVPHFEKMLYDNALLAQVYLDASLATRDADFERVARETLDYILREMTGTLGGYFSSQDADSEGVEGKFYVWTPEEMEKLLGADDATIFAAYFDLSRGGNWAEGEGASILHVDAPLEEFAATRKVAAAELRARLDSMRNRLLQVRARRIPPQTDDKVLADWNGMMIAALARGAQVTGDPRYLAAAQRAADFVLSTMREPPEDGQSGADEARLLHAWRAGRAHIPAFLEDYAHMTMALIELYETAFDPALLLRADRLAAMMLKQFYDAESGGFFSTDGRDASLIARVKEFYDGATPSGNSTAVRALLRLAHLLDRPQYAAAARKTLALMVDAMRRMPMAHHELIRAAAFEIEGATEVAIVVPPELRRQEAQAMIDAAWRTYAPHRVLASSAREAPPGARDKAEAAIQILKGRVALDGRATAYVCRNNVCSTPLGAPESLRKMLGGPELVG